MSYEAGTRHFMVVPHETGGLSRSAWTVILLKNGVPTSAPFDMVEVSDALYVFSFEDDDTDKTTWAMLVYETENADVKYLESFYVRRNIVEQQVKQIRIRQEEANVGGYWRK